MSQFTGLLIARTGVKLIAKWTRLIHLQDHLYQSWIRINTDELGRSTALLLFASQIVVRRGRRKHLMTKMCEIFPGFLLSALYILLTMPHFLTRKGGKQK